MADADLRVLRRRWAEGDPEAFAALQVAKLRAGDLGHPVWAPSRNGRSLVHVWVPETLDGFSVRGPEGMDWGGGAVCCRSWRGLLKLFLHDIESFAEFQPASGTWKIRRYDWKSWRCCKDCNKALINAVPVLRETHVLCAAVTADSRKLR